MVDLTNKVALVTGGTRGIGRACAAALAKTGAVVAICGRTEAKAAEAADALSGETGGKVCGYPCDIGDSNAVDELFKRVEEELGGVSVLVNNAGITQDGLLMRMKDQDWSKILQVNLSGAFYCCRAASKAMIRQRWGRIINVSSIIGIVGQAGQSNYAAAKAGLIGLSKSLAQELGSRNITVNVVAPGYIETDMTSELPEKAREVILSRTFVPRPGKPEDVASAVCYLASEEAGFVTGAVLQVDGGLAM